MRWGLLLALSLTSQIANCEVLDVPPFKSGLCTRYSANSCPKDSLTIATNVLLDVDADGVPVRRNGYAKFNATALTNSKQVRGVWQFDDVNGNHYMIAVTSAAFYSSTGDGTFTVITNLTGFSSSADWNCTAVLGKFYCANGITVFSWDGTTVVNPASATAPLGTLIDNFRNRVLLAGMSGAAGTLRGSGELDGTDYALPTVLNSTSPFSIKVGGVNDGQNITCLMGTYNDVFLIGKRDSLWGLYGFSNDDFQLREISKQVGCLENKSVQEKNGCLYWLSRRGQEKMCGYNIARVSDPIRDQIDVIINTAGNPVSVTDSSQADWEAGTLAPTGFGSVISSTISLGNITPSTTNILNVADARFKMSSSSFTSNRADAFLLNQTPSPNATLTLDLSVSHVDPIYANFVPMRIGVSTPVMGRLDVNLSTTTTDNNPVSTFAIRSCSAISGNDCSGTVTSFIDVPNGTIPATIPTQPYIQLQWKVTQALNCVSGDCMINFSSATLPISTTGYFISQCRNPGTGITAWGSLSCNSIDPSAGLALFVSTGASCNIVTRTTATWNAQVNGGPIGINTAPFVAYKAVFNSTATIVQDCTINWNNGATRPPVASAVYDDRYYLAYTSNTAAGAANDSILVLDRGDRWTYFSGHPCYALTLYQRNLYCGDSGNTGQIFKLDTGTDDNLAAFTAQIRTTAMDLGVFDQQKTFQKLYMLLEPSPDAAQTVSLTAAYILDRGSVTYSLGSIDLNESPASLLTAKVPFPEASPTTAHSIALDLQNTGTNVPWRLFGIRAYFTLLEPD